MLDMTFVVNGNDRICQGHVLIKWWVSVLLGRNLHLVLTPALCLYILVTIDQDPLNFRFRKWRRGSTWQRCQVDLNGSLFLLLIITFFWDESIGTELILSSLGISSFSALSHLLYNLDILLNWFSIRERK